MFAFVEYWVAAANMAFYWTVGTDMPNEEIVVVRYVHRVVNDRKQCDQIGLLLESLRDIFYYKNQPKYWATICAILKTSLNA